MEVDHEVVERIDAVAEGNEYYFEYEEDLAALIEAEEHVDDIAGLRQLHGANSESTEGSEDVDDEWEGFEEERPAGAQTIIS